jgi:tight adherence protein C
VTGSIVFGAIAGLGIVGLIVGMREDRQVFSVAWDLLDRDSGMVPLAGHRLTGDRAISDARAENLRGRLQEWFGTGVEHAIDRVPSIKRTLDRDLATANWTLGGLAERCLLGALVGALAPFVVWALLSLHGAALPLVLPIWVGLVGASLGGVLPVVVFRSQATKGRRQARRVVGCFLDLVVLALAGGLGIEGALHAAAAICETPVARRLVGALDVARDAGRTPWEALGGVGEDLGVSELVELASAVSLAGTEGARIKSTLAAKAASIRTHELADAEADANSVTERLFVPGVLLLIGFLIFIGYPAVARATAGL